MATVYFVVQCVLVLIGLPCIAKAFFHDSKVWGVIGGSLMALSLVFGYMQ